MSEEKTNTQWQDERLQFYGMVKFGEWLNEQGWIVCEDEQGLDLERIYIYRTRGCVWTLLMYRPPIFPCNRSYSRASTNNLRGKIEGRLVWHLSSRPYLRFVQTLKAACSLGQKSTLSHFISSILNRAYGISINHINGEKSSGDWGARMNVPPAQQKNHKFSFLFNSKLKYIERERSRRQALTAHR